MNKKLIFLSALWAIGIPLLIRKSKPTYGPYRVSISPGEHVDIRVYIKNTGDRTHRFGTKAYPRPSGDWEAIYNGCDSSGDVSPGDTDRGYGGRWRAKSGASGYYDVRAKVYENENCSGSRLDAETKSNAIYVKPRAVRAADLRIDIRYSSIKRRGTQYVDNEVENTGTEDLEIEYKLDFYGPEDYHVDFPESTFDLAAGDTETWTSSHGFWGAEPPGTYNVVAKIKDTKTGNILDKETGSFEVT